MQREGLTTKQILFWVAPVLAVFAGLIVWAIAWKTRDPLGGKGPDLMAYLTEEKTLCENRVQDLKAKGINGEREYEKAQAAASACVGYLQGVIDQGKGDKQLISDHVQRLQSASLDFRAWADKKLSRGIQTSQEEFDPIAASVEFLKVLDEQEQARRKAVKDSLEKCKFRSWNEVGVGSLP